MSKHDPVVGFFSTVCQTYPAEYLFWRLNPMLKRAGDEALCMITPSVFTCCYFMIYGEINGTLLTVVSKVHVLFVDTLCYHPIRV